MQLEDILNVVTASDSECEVLSSGGELDDDDDELWELKKRGFHFTGTIAANRLHDAPLMSEKELKKDGGRGTYDSVCESNDDLCLVRWLDNKAVTLLSTYIGPTPTTKVKRYDCTIKKHVDVDRPAVVGTYNANMGGIDLFDMMCTLYKRQVKTMVPVPPSLQTAPPAKKHRVQPGPQLHVRFDNVGHLPMSQENKGRCRYCPNGYSFWTCSKCQVYLCLVCGKNPRNCFAAYHTK